MRLLARSLLKPVNLVGSETLLYQTVLTWSLAGPLVYGTTDFTARLIGSLTITNNERHTRLAAVGYWYQWRIQRGFHGFHGTPLLYTY